MVQIQASAVAGYAAAPRLATHLGYSGCALRMRSRGRAWFVEKSATGDYAARLHRQISRQRQAHRNNCLSFVRIPKVLDERWGQDGSYAAEMDYLLLLDCLHLFATASPAKVRKLVDLLIDYIETNIAASPVAEIPVALFSEKLDQIEAALEVRGLTGRYRDRIAAVRRGLPAGPIMLPLGHAHGDLTLSNVMVASDASEIGLIDFLDGYLDSPLLDIAKLRQDTRFHWLLHIAANRLDRARLEPILAFMDRLILRHFERYPWVREHLNLIEAVNLLRIAPYAGSGNGNARSRRLHDLLVSALLEVSN